MELILIIFYLVVFSFIIYRTKFFSVNGINRPTLVFIFLLKASFAIFFGLLHYAQFVWADTFYYFRDGNTIFQTLWDDPLHYLELVFGPIDRPVPEYLSDTVHNIGYWDNSGSYLVVRFNAIVRLFSFGFYSVHSLFMAFFSLIGLTWIYKTFLIHYPDRKKYLAIVIYLIPSVLFYGSGLHKEGIAIFSIGLLVYNFQLLLLSRFRWWNILFAIIGAFLLMQVKEFFLAAIFPCLIAWLWVHFRPEWPFLKFLLTFLLYWTVMFNIHLILPGFDLSTMIVEKQAEFLELKGRSDIEMENLEPVISHIIYNVPKAVVNTLLRPFPNEIQNIYQFFYFVEVMLMILIILTALIFFSMKSLKDAPLAYLAFFFSLSSFVIIGLIVPNLGAISRYKAPALIFLLCFLVIVTDMKRVKEVFRRT